MKTLYREKLEVYMGDELIRPIKPPRFHYGEIPPNIHRVISDFDTIFYRNEYGKYGIGTEKTWFGNKYLTFYNEDNMLMRIPKKDFKHITIHTSYEIPIAMEMADIISDLSTEEFAEWSEVIGLSALEKLN